MSDNIIELKGVNKWFGDFQVLKNVDLTVGLKQKIVVCGPSGSGKSTLIRCISRLEEHQEGQIFVDGMDYDIRKDEILSKIGYVPQNNIFDNDLNIYENLFLHAELCGLNNVKIKEKILYWANRLNFNQNLKDSIDSTSNSVLKKVAFAKALIQNPDILLIDDLTSSMDYYDRNIIFEIIQEIRASKSILFISQDFSIAELYSDRIIFISNGSVVFNGSTNILEKEINDSYKYRFTFKRIAPVKFLKDLKQNKNIDKVVSKDNNIQITVKDKSIFFDVFKAAVDYELIDFNMSNSKITELFERIVES